MTSRDYFAAHCPSDLAKCNVQSDAEKIAGPYPPDEDFTAQLRWNNKVEAFLRFAYADAMLTERMIDRIPNAAIQVAIQGKPFGSWLEMERAPAGKFILLWINGEVQIGAWLNYHDPSYPATWQDWQGNVISRPWKDDETPVAWMPLPAPFNP